MGILKKKKPAMPVTEKAPKKIKSVKVDCTVKKIEFKTNQVGQVNIVVWLNENKIIKKLGINSIILQSIKSIIKQGLGLKSVLKCVFNKKTGQVIDVAIRESSDIKPAFPRFCEACGMDLKFDTDSWVLSCANYTCPARPAAFLYKLIEVVTGLQGKAVESFVTKYVSGDDVINISHFDEFFFVIDAIKNKNTAPRLRAWEKHHGIEHGKFLFDLDIALSAFLTKKQFKIRDFWKICNFPRMTDECLDELCELTPACIATKKLVLMSKKTQDYITYNTSLMLFLYKKLVDGGVREWIA